MNSLLPPNQIKIWDIFENKFEIIHRDEIKNINFLLKINKFIFVNFLKLLIRLNLNKKFSLFSDKDFEIISKIPFLMIWIIFFVVIGKIQNFSKRIFMK